MTMAVPLRKERADEELTTADLAQGTRPATAEDKGPRPVQSERVEARTGKTVSTTGPEQGTTPLFPGEELENLRTEWNSIQTGFVDEPRRAVEEADRLVASAMKRLAEVFAEERSNLERQWDQGENVSTEDLRVALQRYRSFFHRLLSF
jgi:hypothetical protein